MPWRERCMGKLNLDMDEWSWSIKLVWRSQYVFFASHPAGIAAAFDGGATLEGGEGVAHAPA